MILPHQNAFRLQVFLSLVNSILAGNNILHPPASNIDCFLPRHIALLPFTWIEPFCTKMMFLTLENYKMQTVLLLKINSTISGTRYARPCCLLHWWISYKRNSASSVHLNGAILHKIDVPHPWKPWEIGNIPFKM
jgi:hypothetical protein